MTAKTEATPRKESGNKGKAPAGTSRPIRSEVVKPAGHRVSYKDALIGERRIKTYKPRNPSSAWQSAECSARRTGGRLPVWARLGPYGGRIDDRRGPDRRPVKESIGPKLQAGEGGHLLQLLKAQLKMDNQSAIALSKNPVLHDRSKHIDTKFHFLRECVDEGALRLGFVSTQGQLADIMTKALGRSKFQELRELIGVTKLK